MTILAWGTSLPELQTQGIYNAANGSAYTSAAQLAPYVAEGILAGRADLCAANQPWRLNFTPTADLWFSFYMETDSAGGSGAFPPFIVLGGGVELFRLQQAGGLLLQYHNGTSWQTSGTAITYVSNVLARFDCHFVVHDTTGTLTVYRDGKEHTQATFSAGDTLLRGESLMDEIGLGHAFSSGARETYLSAVFVSTTDSRPIHYAQTAIDGAGAETDWSGAYTDIDEAGGDDADLIQAGTTADKATYTFAALPTALNTGYTVVGVGVSARAAKGDSSPANLQLAARHSTTNGFSGSKALDGVFGPFQHIFPLNPNGGAAWTFTEADAAEVGVQAIT